MSDRTAIEWTDATWNPWRGCDKVSPGCAHCYMFAGQRQYGKDPSVVVRAADATFLKPLSRKWRRESEFMRVVEGRRMRVFTCSWSDWFHETADPWRDEAWDIVRQAGESYDFQILTKRPERIADHLPSDWGDGWPNVWLGVSIENRRFVGPADHLRAVPAAVRFISAEPLLGPLVPRIEDHPRDGRTETWYRWPDGYGPAGLHLHGIDWLIVGGESGPKHRPIKVDWVRDLRDACACGLCGFDRSPDCDFCSTRLYRSPAFFLKQWGGARPGGEALLDGREWREFPQSPAFVSQGALL